MPFSDPADFEINRFKQALSRGKPLLGIWAMLNSTNVVEGIGDSGFDWMLIDGEHAPVSLSDAIDHLRALRGSPTVPVVRLVWNDPVLLKQYLDAGATTLMLPFVQSAAEAEAAVRAMRYAPGGMRGVALMHRATRYGRVRDYIHRASESLCLIVQIETGQALDNLEEIASVDGVDAVFIGPTDLSASLGLLGRPDDPQVTDMIETARERARRLGKAIGVLAPSPELAERFIRSGFDFVSVANDAALLFRNADATAAKFRAVIDGPAEAPREAEA